MKRFLQNPREVGAVCPSTRHLAAAMVRGLSLQPKDVIVELGVGTGAFTPSITELGLSLRYLGVEREPGFCEVLRRRFPQLTFANAQAEQLPQLLQDYRLPAPQAVLSGLPLILLPTMNQIVEQVHEVLAPGGEFRTFSYLQSYPTRSALRLRRLLRETFAEASISRLVVRNFPPAFVLRGKKAD